MHIRRKATLAIVVGFPAVFAAAVAVPFSNISSANVPANEAAEEEGTFRLHKFEQPIGQESYAIKKEGDELQRSVSFQFNDLGDDVPLSAFARLSKDFTPYSMEIHGKMARGTPIDDTVLVEKERIHVSKSDLWSTYERPERYFGISTYAPVALQMMLVRKWQAAGRPKKLGTFPACV